MGSLCAVTADYRDQYYGLRGAVYDAPHGVEPDLTRPRLITTGLIDPLRCLWGEAATKYDKERYERPIVLLDLLDTKMRRWAMGRLVPKLLVATQGKMPEVMIDSEGVFLPCVPVITVTPLAAEEVTLPELAAIFLSPVAFDYLRASKLGAGLSTSAIKVSAADLRDLPAPTDLSRLAEAAPLLADLHDQAARVRYRELMNLAYGLPDADAVAWEQAISSYVGRVFVPSVT